MYQEGYPIQSISRRYSSENMLSRVGSPLVIEMLSGRFPPYECVALVFVGHQHLSRSRHGLVTIHWPEGRCTMQHSSGLKGGGNPPGALGGETDVLSPVVGPAEAVVGSTIVMQSKCFRVAARIE